MSMKKKLTATTMAATLLLGTAAGIPYSSKGLLNAIGLQASVASAATTDSLVEKLNAIHQSLVDIGGADEVRAARDAVRELATSLSDSDKADLVQPIWAKVQPLSDAAAPADKVTAVELFNLITQLAITYDPSGDDIKNRILSEDNRTTVNKLAKLAGLEDGLDELSIADIDDFVGAAFDTLKAGALTIVAKVVATPTITTVHSAIADELEKGLLTGDSDLKLVQILNGLGIKASDILAVKDLLGAEVDPDKTAQEKLESATLVYLLSAFPLTLADGDESDASFTPSLKWQSVPVPDNFLVWSAPTDSDIEYDGSKFVLKSGVSSATATISASTTSALLGVKIFNQEISLQQSIVSYPPVTSGGDAAVQAISSIGAGALNDLAALADALKDADAAKKAELIAQIKAKVAEAIQKMSNIDLSKSVTIDGTKATLKLDLASLKRQIEEISKQAAALNAKLKELVPDAEAVRVVLALNLGDFTAETTEVPLPLELLQAAIDNGIDAVAILMNGLGVTISTDEFSADTTFTVTTKGASTIGDVTDLPVVSDVYEFEFVSDGSPITQFKTPIQLSIPVVTDDSIDTDLLTLAKIINDKLLFYVGKYGDGHVNGSRNSFSTYTVVENKVSFTDTLSVQGWAGRQIQVAAAKGIVEGRGNDQFVPNGDVTRAEFAKMIVKTFGLEDPTATESFGDVDNSDWYAVYVASAVKNGIVNGRTAGIFDPNGKITRAEMAAMASRALLLSGSKTAPDTDKALAGFKDGSSISSTLRDGVALAASEGIIIGDEKGNFNPRDNSTRAQAAVVIYRLLNQ